jgi:hypothetical protein
MVQRMPAAPGRLIRDWFGKALQASESAYTGMRDYWDYCIVSQGDGGGPVNIAPGNLCKDDPARFQISGQAVGIATIGDAIQYNTAYFS